MFIISIILVIVAIGVLVVVSMKISDEEHSKEKEELKSFLYVTSIGGLEEYQTLAKSFEIVFEKNMMRMNLKNYSNKTVVELRKKDIESCEIDTIKGVNEQISLGKIALVGIFALGMKNKQVIFEEVVILKFKYRDETRVFIFKGDHVEPSRVIYNEIQNLLK